MTFTNLIRAYYKKNGITHPDDILITTFEEVMYEENKIAEWIGKQDRALLIKVLDRVEAKNAKLAKTKPVKSAPGGAVQPQSLPLKPMGAN